MKKIFNLTPLIILGATPFIGLGINANSQEVKSVDTKYDERDVYLSFQYEAQQIIQYNGDISEGIESVFVDVKDQISIVETENPVNPEDTLTLDDFESVNFTLTGNDESTLYEGKTVNSALKGADKIDSIVTYEEEVTTGLSWTLGDETVEVLPENKQEFKDVFGNGILFDIAWNTMINRIPPVRENALFNTSFTIEDLENNNTELFEESFVKENDTFSLDFQKEMLKKDFEDDSNSDLAKYAGHDYNGYLHNSFDGIGGGLMENAGAKTGDGLSVLDYNIELVDDEGHSYMIQNGISSIEEPTFDEILPVDSTEIFSNNEETFLEFELNPGAIGSPSEHLLEKTYGLEFKIEEIDINSEEKITLYDWFDPKFNESNNEHLQYGKNEFYIYDDNGDKVLIEPKDDKRIIVSIRDIEDETAPIIETDKLEIKDPRIDHSNSTIWSMIPWWGWVIVSLMTALIGLGVWYLITLGIKTFKHFANTTEKSK